jgi:dihydrofolate synthase/folylpolyglutamate synthase
LPADVVDPASAETFIFASYQRARPFLHGPDERTRRPELTAGLLEALGQPERGLPCLLVAGSKGKGSTAAYAAKLLAVGGASVGLFSSPHLLDVRERIRVDGRAIPADDFTRLTAQVARVVAPRERRLPEGAYHSPLGLLLCVALLYFRQRGVRWAVVEAGRGARFDDTRLVEHPVAALTPIMLEHPGELGGTLARVAWHKAGAIPPGGVAFSAGQRPAAAAALQAEAAARAARLAFVGREIVARPVGRERVEVVTPRRRYPALPTGLRGPHQARNLALALAAAEALRPDLADQPLAALAEASGTTRWPGRCETLTERPLVLVDGAINGLAARAFLAAAVPISRGPVVAIAAAPADKDYVGLFRALGPRVERLLVTRAANPHLRFPDDALAAASRFARRAAEFPTLAAAVEAALPDVGTDGSLWIVGTQSLVADALRLWGRDLETI